MTKPTKGLTFTHTTILHPEDRKLPAKQARKAIMKITQVTKNKVFYTYESDPTNKSFRWMPRDYWEVTYGQPREPGEGLSLG